MNYVESVRQNPKFAAGIFFLALTGLISFVYGYYQSKKKSPKKSNTDHFWVGMKWVGIIYAIIAVISVMVMFLTGTDMLTFMLIGGDVIVFLLRAIGGLAEVLSN